MSTWNRRKDGIGREGDLRGTERAVGSQAAAASGQVPRRLVLDDGDMPQPEGRRPGVPAETRRRGHRDVRCHTGDCSPEVAADALGAQAGWPLRWAYESLDGKIDRLWWIRYWPRWRLESYAIGALAFAVPLLLGHGMWAGYLAFLAFTVGSLLTGWHMMRHRRSRFLR